VSLDGVAMQMMKKDLISTTIELKNGK